MACSWVVGVALADMISMRRQCPKRSKPESNGKGVLQISDVYYHVLGFREH